MDCFAKAAASEAVVSRGGIYLVRLTQPLGPLTARVSLLVLHAADEIAAHELAETIEPPGSFQRINVCRLSPEALSTYGMPAALAYVLNTIEMTRGVAQGSLRLGRDVEPEVAHLLAKAVLAGVQS